MAHQCGELKCKIGPSILNSDLSCLTDECEKLLKSGADYLHLDVMDGNFVPNLTFGAPVVKCLRQKITKAFFDMHMMVNAPDQWINDMADAGANQYTFHFEATNNPSEVIRHIKESGMKVGIGVKPKTNIDVVLPYIDDIDMLLVMTVEPGFGGQKFMQDMMPKIQLIREKFPYLDIEVDGGVGPGNIEVVAQAGANMIVSGTAVVKNPNPQKVINELRTGVTKWLQINSKN